MTIDDDLATALADALHGRRVASAESCTAGAVAGRLAGLPGSGEWFLGGIVAYHREVKQRVLDVEPGPLVSERTAVQMAIGVARLLDADVAVSTTGACGPVGLDGAPPGMVVIGWYRRATATTPYAAGAEIAVLDGDPDVVAREATRRALAVLVRVARGDER